MFTASEKLSKNLNIAIEASLKAGSEILRVYNEEPFHVQYKSDNSPLTKADKLAHETICSFLNKTEIPIISEEGEFVNYKIRKKWKQLWMIDPLDGTKEFIKRNGEFTVNISLIIDSKPAIGVVYAPALRKLYFADINLGSYLINNIVKFEEFNFEKAIDLQSSKSPDIYTFVVSKSHPSDETKSYIDEKKKIFKKVKVKSFGSSLKLCKIAEGEANCYPRFGKTMEWDTAAAHAVVEYSNCKIFSINNKSILKYNKKEFINPYFIANRI